MAEPRVTERTGWRDPCRSCGKAIAYTLLTNQLGPTPFFYAERGCHVLLRRSDRDRVDELYAAADGAPTLDAMVELWSAIVATAPAAPDGGRFGLWTSASCPHCGEALVPDGGRRDPARRIHEPKVVLLDGVIVVGDDAATTWRVRVRPRSRGRSSPDS